MQTKLLHWQSECLDIWKANHCRGIVNAVTGSGKTVLAAGAIDYLSKMYTGQSLKIKIVVPKTFLMYQWQSALINYLDISYGDIGFISGMHKTSSPRGFTIYVINSARYSLSRQIIDEAEDTDAIFLIADECHHYGTDENSRIFDFMRYIPQDIPIYTLGLSATPISRNYESVLVPALGDEIYRFTFYNALKADIISRFAVFNICVRFDAYEEAEYEGLSEKLGIALFQLKNKCRELRLRNGRDFFAGLEYIAKNSADMETRELAQSVMLLAIRRKEIVYLAKARIKCVVDLVGMTRNTAKIIIFGERIEMASEIYEALSAVWPGEVGIYHSKLHKDIRTKTLRQFEDREIRILVSCKTLDEGLNVSETDVGIVVSSTSSKRQRIQRLGRVLRKKLHENMAYFYYLYVDDTTEEDEMLNEMTDSRLSGLVNVIDVMYDERDRIFYNTYFDDLVSDAVSYMYERRYNDELIGEFLRNTRIGLLSCDWLATEEICREKIKQAEKKSETNYYIAMLLLIKARTNKLSFKT